MKKFVSLIVIILSIVCITNGAYADDFDISTSDDLWDNWNDSQPTYAQNKSVSDEDFEKAVQQLEEKKNKKIRKKLVPKGEEFHQSNETEIINEQSEKESLPVVCIPAEIILENGVLPIGHYQVKGIKEENGEVSIELYQAHFVMAKFPAIETKDDFEAETISFAKCMPEGDNNIKIIFGSIDFNAYAIVDINNF